MPIGNWIQTASAAQLFPLDPQPEDIRIQDIAHQLAMTCRWAGAVRLYYSVAEHCVRISYEVERHVAVNGDPEHVRLSALAGLLHDAEEYVFGDMPRPIKYEPFMSGYRAASVHLRTVIFKRFGVPQEYWTDEVIKRFDNVLLATEKRDLMYPEPAAHDPLPPPLRSRIEPWTWSEAEQRFMSRFAELYRRG
jgi:hypothetical protein